MASARRIRPRGMTLPQLAEWILAERCERDPATGCRLWRGARTGAHGHVRWMDRDLYPHRVVAEARLGPCPDGSAAVQSCGRRLCCEPSHLRYEGRPAIYRRRSREGPRHRCLKLSPGDVREIRRRLRAGDRLADIAASQVVGKSAISRIGSGATWSHVE